MIKRTLFVSAILFVLLGPPSAYKIFAGEHLGFHIAQSLPLLDQKDLEKYSKPTKRESDPAFMQGASGDDQAIPLETSNLLYISYFKTIKKRIDRVRSYPVKAKESFLRGKSRVQFTVLKDGTVEDVKVVSSSGFDVLDKNAVETIKKAAPFSPFPKRIQSSKLSIIAELDYFPDIAGSGDLPVGIGIPLNKLK